MMRFGETEQTDELFRSRRGHALKLPTSAGQRLFPEAFGGKSGLTCEMKARGIVKRLPEVVVKVDKASKGIKGFNHLKEAVHYISRNGKIELEDQDGQQPTHDELDAILKQWAQSADLPKIPDDQAVWP